MGGRLKAPVVAIVCIGLLLWAAPPEATQTSPGVPAPVFTAVTDEEALTLSMFRDSVGQVVDHPARQAERWSILAVSLDRGDTLFARSPGQPLAPASNIKLFTAAAALEYLGADHRFTTYLLADGPVREGVLEGNLYLYGTGDPTLGTRFAERPAPGLLALADTLEQLGIREVRGDVVGDGSHFTGPGTGQGWQTAYVNAWYASPAGALAVHENLVRIEADPGPHGEPPELTYVPGGAGIAVRNEAVSGAGGRLAILRIDYDGPILVTGRVGGSSSAAVPVGDPAMYAAALMRDVLTERGIVVHGVVRAIDRPEASPITGRKIFAPAVEGEAYPRVLAELVSPPLLEILQVINRQSHNFYSEQVLRAVGRAATGTGSAEAGARAVGRVLARAGIDPSGLQIVDGCGLSPLNSASARDFVALLAYVARSPYADLFMSTLPVAGEDRRFRRMGGTPAEGNLRAKTGTITNVSSLSGYVTAANGERIAFSIIGNDLRAVAAGKQLEDVVGARLAAFDRALPVATQAEEPVAAGEG
jgi:serine-type D-Ala-D-Ala carboxypeptidase/endopeptidase (penicillin-binding protein 4)